ncbi:response regulator transcription factor [Nocardioides sp. zg-DK7169]|uniref:helix-turn-helix transcriptional regulator n=1 Tax=Nocardioides sp. zg-DK7169 TaxID=2736600 RepID=UPI0015562204|nr:response regulator transcription factor [Nocardioides sp. zg-DK7169]NPC96485.1 response regulator transcription factor [Nocardioides sp. zg-DK7169]
MTSATSAMATRPDPDPVQLAIANDYEVIVRGLQAMLEPYAEVEVMELTTSAQLDRSPGVILYDTFGRMPGHDPTLATLVHEHRAPVLVFSWRTYPAEIAMAQGAAGYLHKSCSAAELVHAVVAVHEGRTVLEPTTTHHRVPAAERSTWPGHPEGLSPREAEIIACISRGMSNQEIADQSFLSVNTVKTHIRSAYRKIGVERRSQAVLWGVAHGLVEH